VLKIGDQLDSSAIEPLTFDPENAPPGPAGDFAFTVDDGRGGEVSASVAVTVLGPGSEPTPASLDAALWDRLGPKAGEAELRTFLQLFPESPFAAEAEPRLRAAAKPERPASSPPEGRRVLNPDFSDGWTFCRCRVLNLVAYSAC
jgi:hypothetical protein